MLWFSASAAIGIGLIFLTFCFGPEAASAASLAGTHDTVEKTVPQGKDPPRTDGQDLINALVVYTRWLSAPQRAEH